MDEVYDLAIIGGGVNGCGIARDAAGRGLSVYLCEQNDLGSGTSSWSTKLIHGGLRYLEHYEFRLVREALLEREVLWGLAPHIIAPLRFVLPHHRGLRPAWLLRLGLFLYDHIGGRKRLPPARTLDLREDVAGRALKPRFTRAFEYSDCAVDDVRLVVLNALDAREHGAVVETRTRCASARREAGFWDLAVSGPGGARTLKARALVNAAGPWVADVLGRRIGVNTQAAVRLVKGSHIVVDSLFDHDRGYIFQNADGRIVFAIPYQQRFTLIGTTDQDYEGDPAGATASPEEIEYLCSAVSEYFAKPVTPADVVWAFAGVRPLYDDGASKAQEATRDYVLKLDHAEGAAPLLSIFGGKITTYRRLAQAALAMLEPFLPGMREGAGWTGKAPLPGGDMPLDGAAAVAKGLAPGPPALPPAHAERLARTYGTRAAAIVGHGDMGPDFGATLSGREVEYLMREEWAVTAEDVLWRRTKLGLVIDTGRVPELEAFMAAHAARKPATPGAAR